MTNAIDVAIVGAGPYGLSLAAHLDGLGVSHRIFGKPLDTWRNHMPRTMLLKSEGLASSLSSPKAGSRLDDYCAAHGLEFQDHDLPVSLDRFNAYATYFAERFVPQLENTMVTGLARAGEGFALTLATGEQLFARKVVLAVGITAFAYTPEVLAGLGDKVTHSFAHRDGEMLKGKDVVVLGAGASAIDTAALLDECGAKVRILARTPVVRYHTPPDGAGDTFFKSLQKPQTGIGPGWRSFFCTNMPLMFHKLPESIRLRATRTHLGPAPGWFMRKRIEGRVPTLLSRSLEHAELKDGRVSLSVSTGETLTCEHVVSATGYRPDVDRLGWVSADLRAGIDTVEKTPVLTDNFETSVRGLYFMGPAAANSFGPLMRFMVGSEFAAPRLAGHLHRRLGGASERRAA